MNKNSKTILVVLALIIVILLGYLAVRKPAPYVAPTPVVTAPVISGNAADLTSLSISAGAYVASGQVVTGSLKGNYFFEANARGMLLDSGKNEIKTFSITATSDWMTEGPVNFSFTLPSAGAAAGTSGYIRLANDNPSGDSARDKFIDIPVVFQ